MEIETLRELQAYGYFFFIVFLVVVLYGYFYHLIKSEKKGRRNYEKYSKLALDDELNERPIEPISQNQNNNTTRN
ncbi:cytochrome c oxidase, cbb3-type, CcoQ subunit [Campylobacter sp. RM12327]|uniref:Cytochrome c oxidase, Cbb3-type, CcoQ subunit n=1 Tax=Campylobacter sputorum subsp. sputorum TaxID=32024 RepID=A0A381DKM7_9BACT|nr:MULTISPECIES: cytochrome c oxidase, cbb3-type, CcoQ subunit [Campylobacter]ASM34380.1 cytochrome c oxidase CcoNOPQ, cbb3-type, subunit IV [Campylobacter sputorum aubsp. sputorum RM3237]ASM36048.1 cytochrome c oxidase CcoNOPQ, cbb3-type, subunit IV [Campylobacter sputorum bv. faecalis CCUG 20703]ASM37728.1 cytochrome c oxidase CcoNOPQ, cbb3-type, subunit IV [Campylobacter sputorum bv. paraureolyticus LMG 11764]ASM39379.1 cytochrome c oxidase CcoNOPQ, cbb3-type, subunit IV [Campylobacter sputo